MIILDKNKLRPTSRSISDCEQPVTNSQIDDRVWNQIWNQMDSQLMDQIWSQMVGQYYDNFI